MGRRQTLGAQKTNNTLQQQKPQNNQLRNHEHSQQLEYEYAYSSGNSAIQLVKVFSAVLGSSHSTQHCEAAAGSGRGGGGKEEEEEEEEIVVSVR